MKLLCRQTDNLIIVDFSGFYEEKIQNWQTYLYRKPTLEDVDLAMQEFTIATNLTQKSYQIQTMRINTYE